ncbi:MAG: NmrA family NAD(P)-binding protein [Proteobacteria bacterium]|nr:NmrA family NAD(P)-binding protein [Pseudomonadota bacterium]
MRVLAVGGSGGMGKVAVKAMLSRNFCEHIVVADINGENAKTFADECEGSVSWIQLDISDGNALKKALTEVDIVMSTVGPYFRYGVLVLKACIENGCHYVDINDDWEPTLEMLELHEDAKKAGITAVIGMGASPGMTNLIAAKAISELDRVEEIYTGWDLDSAKPDTVSKEPTAALVHALHQMTGQVRVFRDGAFIDETPLEKFKLDYPGIGVRSVNTFGHPEAVTFPYYYPTLRCSLNVMTTAWTNLLGIRVIVWLVNKGLMSMETAAGLVEKAEGARDPEETNEKKMENLLNSKAPALPEIYALAKGTKNDKPASAAGTLLSAPEGGMGGATSVPLAVGVSLLADGQVTERGVFAPEGIFDPDLFFGRLAPLCSPVKTDINDLVLMTRSWEPEKIVDALIRHESSRV